LSEEPPPPAIPEVTPEPEVADFGAMAFILGLLVLAILLMVLMVRH
jgi:hypothetical protein